MSLSSSKKHRKPFNVFITPWRHASEWSDVADNLFSTDSAQVKIALDRITIWRRRVGTNLPVGVDISEALVLAHTADINHSVTDDTALRMLYGAAIVRFVNLVSETQQSGNHLRTIHHVLNNVGIPRWIVEVRHEVTHGHLPSLEIMRYAVGFCLIWLKDNYWSQPPIPQPDDVHDTIINQVPYKEPSVNNVLKKEAKLTLLARTLLRRFVDISLAGNTPDERVLEKVKTLIGRNIGVFSNVLCSNGFLIATADQLRKLQGSEINNDEPEECMVGLSETLQKIWEPVLEMIAGHDNGLGTLFGCLLERYLESIQHNDVMFEEHPRSKALVAQLRLWLFLMIDACCQQVYKSTIAWDDALMQLLREPNPKSKPLIEKIMSLLQRSDSEKIITLFDLYCSNRIETSKSATPGIYSALLATSNRTPVGVEDIVGYKVTEMNDHGGSSSNGKLDHQTNTTPDATIVQSGASYTVEDWAKVPIGAPPPGVDRRNHSLKLNIDPDWNESVLGKESTCRNLSFLPKDLKPSNIMLEKKGSNSVKLLDGVENSKNAIVENGADCGELPALKKRRLNSSDGAAKPSILLKVVLV